MKKEFSRFLLIAGFSSLMLSGCSWLEDWPPAGENARAPYPEEVRVMQSGQGTWLAPTPTAPVGAVPVATAPVQGGPIATYPDVIARINTLEAEVAALRNDMSMMAPVLTSLTTMQKDLSEILASMQPAAGNAAVITPGAARTRVAEIYQPQKPQMLKPLQPASQKAAALTPAVSDAEPAVIQPLGAAVEAVRLGEHENKTRIVLDVTGDVGFSYDLDNSERLLVIDLPGASWRAAAEKEISGSPLVSSFQAASYDEGTRLAIQLSQPSEVIWAQTIPAMGSRHPRIVIDLAR